MKYRLPAKMKCNFCGETYQTMKLNQFDMQGNGLCCECSKKGHTLYGLKKREEAESE